MRTPAPASAPYPTCRFGPFELQPADRRLLADGAPVSLGARAFDLLVALVARAGQLVSKNDLLTLVWPGLVVEENNLQVQVSTLRKLLGPNALATIPGRGYRFELPVERSVEHGAAVPPAPGPEVAAAAPAGTIVPSPARAPSNLPPRLPTLYGRAPDVDAVKALLARHVVVTIAGAGGIGKTRLAQAVAAEIADAFAGDYPDGVWWVELAPLSDGALATSAVARAMGTQLPADRPPVEALAALLASQRLLLVLDNCEHLTDAVAVFVEAVCAAAPGVRLLVTSQETLKSTDEHVYRVGALAVPASDAGAEAMRSGAVELFVARAQGVDPRFTLTPANASAVVEICRRLDGIPLAIELAAARVPLLGVEGLRARLDERFHLLTAGARVVLRRHQTLRATLEWSHGLLTNDEQTVFRRLGVFAGSFTLEAAQHVASDERMDPWAALDHLGALVDKSLVLAEGDPIPRYRMLETARAYALERLAEADETGAILRRHAEAMLQLLSSGDGDDARWHITPASVAACQAELDNLRAALAWVSATSTGQDLAVPLAGASWLVWKLTIQLAEGLERCLALRHHVRDDVPVPVRARYWLTIAGLGLYSNRRECYDAALHAADLYRSVGDASHLYDALVCAAAQGVRLATTEAMERAIAEAARLERPEWPDQQRGSLQFALCRWHMRMGRYEEALAAALRQAASYREGGHTVAEMYATFNIAWVELLLERMDAGVAHARAAIAELEARKAVAGAGHLYFCVAVGCALLDRFGEAMAAARTSYKLLVRENDEHRALLPLALCAVASGRVADAARIRGFMEAERLRAGAFLEAPRMLIRERLEAELAARLAPDELARLQDEGANLRKDDAFRLALAGGE
jgi:predicted ATPase/DNA-binding winged helix-turn-helix (wHTH) protein